MGNEVFDNAQSGEGSWWSIVRDTWAKFCSYVPFPWSSLKGVMSSKFARLTVIVPIIGWVLVYNDNLILFLEELLERDLPNEFGWKVYIFYVGLFCISISSILYAIFCPSEVNNHRSLVDFVKHTRLVYTERYGNALSRGIGRAPFQWGEPPEDFRNKKTGKFPLVRMHSENEDEIIDTLCRDYERMNASWPILRVCALLIFCFGAILSSIPTLSTVHWASCLVAKNAESNLWLEKLQNTCSSKANSGEDHLEDV